MPSVNFTGVSQVDTDKFRVSFDALAARGTYTAVISPTIADMLGRLMDQDQFHDESSFFVELAVEAS